MSLWHDVIEEIFPKSRGWARWLGNETGNLGQSTSQQTQTRNVAPPGAMEGALNTANAPALVSQTQAIQDFINRQNQFAASPQFQAQQNLGSTASDQLRSMLAGGGMTLSPQQIQYIQQSYQPFVDQNLRLLQQQAQNAAGARGLALTDTAINAPYMQSVKDYLSNVTGQQAQSALQYGSQQSQFDLALQQAEDAARQQDQANRLAGSQAVSPGYQYGLALGNQRIQSAPVSTSGTSNAPWPQNLAYLGQALSGYRGGGLIGAISDIGTGAFAKGSGTPGQPGYTAPGVLRPAVDAAGNWLSTGAKDLYGAIFNGGGASSPQPGFEMPPNTYGGSSYTLGQQGNYAPDMNLSFQAPSAPSGGGDGWSFDDTNAF